MKKILMVLVVTFLLLPALAQAVPNVMDLHNLPARQGLSS